MVLSKTVCFSHTSMSWGPWGDSLSSLPLCSFVPRGGHDLVCHFSGPGQVAVKAWSRMGQAMFADFVCGPWLIPAGDRKSHFMSYFKALCQEQRVNFSFVLVKLPEPVCVWGIEGSVAGTRKLPFAHWIPNSLSPRLQDAAVTQS